MLAGRSNKVMIVATRFHPRVLDKKVKIPTKSATVHAMASIVATSFNIILITYAAA
jgi:hypothetical protein